MDFRGRRIVVTGGAGLIGSFLTERLVAAGARVIVADDFSKGRGEYLATVLDRVEVRRGDLESLPAMKQALAGAELVFHLASRAYGIGYSATHHLAILDHNERITENLVTVLAHQPVAHLLVSSSSCVYPDDGPAKLTELPTFMGEPEAANWGYGWSKRFLEQKTALLCRETGIPVTVVRPFNIYGERYSWSGENSQALPMLVKKVMDGDDPIVIWGSGEQRRNYWHAFDCAHAMARLIERDTMGTVNIGTEETISLRELTELICRLADKRPILSFDLEKPQGRTIKSSDSKQLRAFLPDFRIAVNLKEGLRRMIGWYRETFV